MDTLFCPVTLSNRVEVLEEIEVESICRYYINTLGIDVRHCFKGYTHIKKCVSAETGYVFFYPFDIAGDEQLYAELENFDWYYLNDKWEYQEALKHIQSHETVLEVGCGEGAFLSILDRARIKATGLELNKQAISRAVSKNLNVLGQTIGGYAARNQPVNVVCLFQVVEHIAAINTFLGDCLDALVQGGKLIVSVPNNDAFIKYDSGNALNLPPHHMGRWNAHSLSTLEKFFPVKVIRLVNEPLQPYHVKWFTTVFFERMLGARVYHRLVRGSWIERLAQRSVAQARARIDGHSILAIFEKL